MILKVLLVILVVLAVLYVAGMVLRQRRPADLRFTDIAELPADVRDRIDLALAQGKKIEAIKIYRQATRADLVHAKEAVEVYAWKRGS